MATGESWHAGPRQHPRSWQSVHFLIVYVIENEVHKKINRHKLNDREGSFIAIESLTKIHGVKAHRKPGYSLVPNHQSYSESVPQDVLSLPVEQTSTRPSLTDPESSPARSPMSNAH